MFSAKGGYLIGSLDQLSVSYVSRGYIFYCGERSIVGVALSVGILKSRIDLLSITSNEILKGLIIYCLYHEKVRNRCYTFVFCNTGIGASDIRTNELKCLREMVKSLLCQGQTSK